MKRKQLFILLIISIFLLSGCVQEYAVNAEILPKNAGEVKGDKTYQSGQKIKLEANSKENYEFVGWEKDGEIVNKNDTYEFEINKDVDLVAKFNKKKYQLNMEVNDKKMGSVKGSGKYLSNEEITVEAIPNEDYEFVGWYNQEDELISKKENYNLKIKSDLTLIARFKEKEEFSVELDKNIEDGELFGEGSYIEGDKQYIRAEVVPGYEFNYWEDNKGNIFSEKMEKMLTVNKDLDLTAIYKKEDQNYYLNYSEDEIKKRVKMAFYTYTETEEGHYVAIPHATDKLYKTSRNGEYSISHYPGIGYRDKIDKENLDVIIKEIIVENDAILVNVIIETPKITIDDKESFVKEFKKDLIKRQEEDKNLDLKGYFGSNVNLNYDLKDKYSKKVKFKIIDEELKIVEFEKPKHVLKELDGLYRELVVDKIDDVKVQLNNGKPVFEFNYDGIIFKQTNDMDILDPNYFLNKTEFYVNNKKIYSFERFWNDFSNYLKSIGDYGFQQRILNGLDFMYDGDHQVISICSQYGTSTGGNPVFIYGYFDIKDEKFNYFKNGNLAFGKCNNIYYSPNKKMIGYTYTDMLPTPFLEIYMDENRRIKVIPNLLSKEMQNYYNHKRVFIENIEWSKDSKDIFFDIVIKERNKDLDLVTKEVDSFKFNINENKLIEVE